VNVVPPPEVSEPADSKLLMTNPSLEPEEHRPRKPVRIILPREVCTTPEETAKLLHRAQSTPWRVFGGRVPP
jgi:hypothetical protein